MNIELTGKRNVYQEIVEQYSRYIRMGVFREGEQLPSCRKLATELGINPNTVERAYATLEVAGFIKCLPKKGVFVLSQESPLVQLEKEATAQFRLLRKGGLSKERAAELLEEAYREDSQ